MMDQKTFEKKYAKELENHELLTEFEAILEKEMLIVYDKNLRSPPEDHYFDFKGVKFLTPIWSEEGLKNEIGQLALEIHMLRWAGLWEDLVTPENIENIREVIKCQNSKNTSL